MRSSFLSAFSMAGDGSICSHSQRPTFPIPPQNQAGPESRPRRAHQKRSSVSTTAGRGARLGSSHALIGGICQDVPEFSPFSRHFLLESLWSAGAARCTDALLQRDPLKMLTDGHDAFLAGSPFWTKQLPWP
jgi:hypothetical protein